MKNLLLIFTMICLFQVNADANPTMTIINNTSCSMWVRFHAQDNPGGFCSEYPSDVYLVPANTTITYDMYSGGSNPISWTTTIPSSGVIWGSLSYYDFDPAGSCTPSAGNSSCGPYDRNVVGCNVGSPTGIGVSNSIASCLGYAYGICIKATAGGIAPNGVVEFD